MFTTRTKYIVANINHFSSFPKKTFSCPLLSRKRIRYSSSYATGAVLIFIVVEKSKHLTLEYRRQDVFFRAQNMHPLPPCAIQKSLHIKFKKSHLSILPYNTWVVNFAFFRLCIGHAIFQWGGWGVEPKYVTDFQGLVF